MDRDQISRASTSLLAGLGAIPVAIGLTNSVIVTTISVFTLALLTYGANSVAAPYISLGFVFGSLGLLVHLAGQFWQVTINGGLLVLIVLAFLVISSFQWQRFFQPALEASTALSVAVPAVIGGLYIRTISLDPAKSFARLSGTGEDVGTWLDGTARTLKVGGSLQTGSLPSGGVTYSLLTSIASALAKFSLYNDEGIVQSGVLLLRMNWTLIVSASIFASLTATLMCAKLKIRGTWTVGLSAGLIVLPFGISLLEIGHFTALIASVFLLCAALYCVEVDLYLRRSQSFSVCGFVLMGFAVAGSWYPLYSLIVVCSLVALTCGGIELWRRSWLRLKAKVAGSGTRDRIVITSLLLVVLWVLKNSQMWQFVVNASDFEYVKFNFGLGGGYAPVNPYLAFIVLGIAALQVPKWTASHSRSYLSVLVLGVSLSAISFVIFNTLVPPYGPTYGALKFLHLATMVLIPLAVGFLARTYSGLSKTDFSLSLSLAVAVAALIIAQWAPIGYLANVVKPMETKPWAEAVVKEIESHPDRKVLCLDTRETQDWDGYDSYACSRMAAGLQGITGYESNVWTAGNICQISSSQLAETIPKSFYRDLTIIVTDRGRLSSGHACTSRGWGGNEDWGVKAVDPKWTLGWLTGVDWRAVKVIDYEGNEVQKSFDYLLWNDYDSLTIESLNSLLKSE
jgi:hypothetical protein